MEWANLIGWALAIVSLIAVLAASFTIWAAAIFFANRVRKWLQFRGWHPAAAGWAMLVVGVILLLGLWIPVGAWWAAKWLWARKRRNVAPFTGGEDSNLPATPR